MRTRRISAQPRNRCAGLCGLQPAARRPRFSVVRLQSRRPVCARAARRASTACRTNFSTHPGRSSCGCVHASRRCSRHRNPPTARRCPTELFAMLADRGHAPPGVPACLGLSPEWARKLSAPFVLDPSYGTRCSTVLTLSGDDALVVSERRFDANGAAAGESEYALNAAADIDAGRSSARNPRADWRLSLEFPPLPPVSGVMPTLQNNHRPRLPAITLLTLVIAQFAVSRERRHRRWKCAASGRTSAPTCSPTYRSSVTRIRTICRPNSSSGCRSAASAKCAARCVPSATTSRRSPPR